MPPYCQRHEMLYTRDSHEVWGCPTCRISDAKWLAKHRAQKYRRESVPASSMRGDFAYDQVAADRYAMETRKR